MSTQCRPFSPLIARVAKAVIGNWICCTLLLEEKKIVVSWTLFVTEDERLALEKNDTILPNAEITFHLKKKEINEWREKTRWIENG